MFAAHLIEVVSVWLCLRANAVSNDSQAPQWLSQQTEVGSERNRVDGIGRLLALGQENRVWHGDLVLGFLPVHQRLPVGRRHGLRNESVPEDVRAVTQPVRHHGRRIWSTRISQSPSFTSRGCGLFESKETLARRRTIGIDVKKTAPPGQRWFRQSPAEWPSSTSLALSESVRLPRAPRPPHLSPWSRNAPRALLRPPRR